MKVSRREVINSVAAAVLLGSVPMPVAFATSNSPIRVTIDHKHIVNQRWDILTRTLDIFFQNAGIVSEQQKVKICNIVAEEIKYCSTDWRVPGWKECKRHVLFLNRGIFHYGMYNAKWEPLFGHSARLNESAS